MLAPWPQADPAHDSADEACCEGIIGAIRAVRALRAEMKVDIGRKLHLLVIPSAEELKAPLLENEGAFCRLCGASAITLFCDAGDCGKTVSVVCPAAEIRIPLGDLVDTDKEIAPPEQRESGGRGRNRARAGHACQPRLPAKSAAGPRRRHARKACQRTGDAYKAARAHPRIAINCRDPHQPPSPHGGGFLRPLAAAARPPLSFFAGDAIMMRIAARLSAGQMLQKETFV